MDKTKPSFSDYLNAADTLLKMVSLHYSIGVGQDDWERFNNESKRIINTKHHLGDEDYLSLCELLQDEGYLIGEGDRNNRITIKGRLLLLKGGYKLKVDIEEKERVIQKRKFWIPIIVSIAAAAGTVITAYVNFSKLSEKDKAVGEATERIIRLEAKMDSIYVILAESTNEDLDSVPIVSSMDTTKIDSSGPR